MSDLSPSTEEVHSDEEPWYAGYDVVDLEATPVTELPEDDGFLLICPVEDCECEGEFDHLGEVRSSGWTRMSMKDHILTDGTTLKEAYCPLHSLKSGTGADSSRVPNLRQGLGIPHDASAVQSRSQNNTGTDLTGN